MRSFLSAAICAALLAATAVPALAHPSAEAELTPTMPTDLTHASTDNVDYVGRFPEHSGTAGGRLVGDTYFLTDPRGVYAYDVSTPDDPTLLGSVRLFQNAVGAALAQEDPDTDGNILIVDGATTPGVSNRLQVVDVSDPTDLRVIGSAPVSDHTWTCVSDGPGGRAVGHARDRSPKGKGVPDHARRNGCAYVYGRTGWIVDLTDPTAPTVLENGWREAADHGTTGRNSPYTHDLTEIRTGLVMTAGASNILLDTSDPAAPVHLNTLDQEERFSRLGYHSVEWARDGKAPIAVFGTEIAPSGPTNLAGSDCEGDDSVIETWDTRAILEALETYEKTGDPEVVRAAAFTRIDAFDAGGRGIFLQGQAPAHVLYCAHWMEPHPDFDDGGLLAVSYYDRGTRFVEVDANGIMKERGWMTPAEGYSGSVQWIGTAADGGEVAYVMDYRRGMEVVKFFPDREASAVLSTQADVIAAGATVTPVAAADGPPVPLSSAVAAAAGMALAAVGLRRRRSSDRTG